MESLNYDFFSERVGQKVSLADPVTHEKFDAEIASVKKGNEEGKEYSSFAVTFNKSAEAAMQDNSYLVSHADINDELLFCSPKSETAFEMIFSQKL